jgi:hypothetical protein
MGARPSKNLLGLIPPDAKDFETPEKSARYISELIRAIKLDRMLVVNEINSGGVSWPCPYPIVAHMEDETQKNTLLSMNPQYNYIDEWSYMGAAPYVANLTSSDLSKQHTTMCGNACAFNLPAPGEKGKMISFLSPYSAGSAFDIKITPASGGMIFAMRSYISSAGWIQVSSGVSAGCIPLVLQSRNATDWDVLVYPYDYNVDRG